MIPFGYAKFARLKALNTSARNYKFKPSRIAEGAGGRHREGAGIEPVVHSTRNYVPLKVRIQVGYVDGSSVAAAGIIEADQRRKGEAALSVEDPIPLPAPNQMVHPAGGATGKALPVSERQLIAEVRVELVFDAVGSHTFVPLAIVGTQKIRRLILARRRQDGGVQIQHLAPAVI